MKPNADQHPPGQFYAGRRLAAPALTVLLGIGSCSSPGPVPLSDHRSRDLDGVRQAERSVPATDEPRSQPGIDQRAALLNGVPIFWDDLRPSMAEAAGGPALQEAVLDRLIGEQMQSRGLAISNEDIAAERSLLIASVSHDAAATGPDAERLLDQVRRSRGLGELRFESLLERNAKMRKLVAGTIAVSEDEVRQAFDLSHGPRYRARVILLPTERQAMQVRQALVADPTNLSVRFADAAAKQSTDPSAARGGLLEPISPADPAYPSAARRALEQLKAGEISPVVAVDRGSAIFLLDESIPADGVSFADAADRIRAEVRKRRERLAMDDIARRMLRSANLSILDRSLDWSWRNSLGPTPP